jgi:Tfp pilus assembly protein PilX
MMLRSRKRQQISAQDGFSLIVVLSVMLVTSLLLVAAFTASGGEIQTARRSTNHTRAYYAALAGVQEYTYKLDNEPDFWETCEGVKGETEGTPYEVNGVKGETEHAHYEVKVLRSSSSSSACEAAHPFTTAIQSKGLLANTFRIESTGCTGRGAAECEVTSRGEETHSIVATYQVTGFLDYAYFTQYEDEDWSLNGEPQATCERYYAARKGAGCEEIYFGEGDSVHGPFHTDDTANITCGTMEFGRNSSELGGMEPDIVEIKGGLNVTCGTNPTINTKTKELTTPAKQLEPPPSDGSLALYVEAKNKFEGVTHLVLNGTANTIEVLNKGVTSTIEWPKNGLIYIAPYEKAACTYKYEQHTADLANEIKEEPGCGTVYVSGTYSKSLTIGASKELIINGSLEPTGVTLGQEPSGTETLGLIATGFVRVYHPVTEGGGVVNTKTTCTAANASGTMLNPWIYAAILSTSHSFTVDNDRCGDKSELEKLHIYGAIAQKFRGIVGVSGTAGYVKAYQYDERLATDEPPYFLAPLKAGWRIIRETECKKKGEKEAEEC